MNFGVIYHVGADGGTGAIGLEIECFVVVAHALTCILVPKAVGIVAVEGQHLAEGHRLRQFGPPRAGIERQVETYAEGYALQCHQIVARTTILIVKLAGDDRSPVFPLQAGHLGEYLAVEFLGKTEKHSVGGAQLAALLKEPVGHAAVAHLAVAEGANAQHDGHVLLLAYFEEASQIALAIPSEDALLFLYVVPEDVGGYHGHPTLFHLSHLCAPLVGRDARIVYLAHDGTDAAAVHHEAMAVPSDRRHLGTSQHAGEQRDQ